MCDPSDSKQIHRELIEALNQGISKEDFDRRFEGKSVSVGFTAHRFVEVMREARELRPLLRHIRFKTPRLLSR